MKISKYIACLILPLICNSVYSANNNIIHDKCYGNGMKITTNYNGQNIEVTAYTNKNSCCAAEIRNINSVFLSNECWKVDYISELGDNPLLREQSYQQLLENSSLVTNNQLGKFKLKNEEEYSQIQDFSPLCIDDQCRDNDSKNSAGWNYGLLIYNNSPYYSIYEKHWKPSEQKYIYNWYVLDGTDYYYNKIGVTDVF